MSRPVLSCPALQLESVLNTLEERLRQYHACCHRLALLPATAKRAAGTTYEMSVNRAAATPQELISGDIKVRLHGVLPILAVVAGQGKVMVGVWWWSSDSGGSDVVVPC
jgi:hypothetical protein